MISYRLFIEGEELVLNEDVQVAITKQFEDITNPTVIMNDWSKTVNIPMCQTNNRIFGHIYEPKKTIVASSNPNQKLTGIYFDPTRKLDFRLQYGSAVVMVGYAKMNSITQQHGKGTYNITLNGELGKIFQELNKITFNVNSDDSDYIIDGSQYVDSTINKSLVNSSWTSSGQTHYDITGATITDIIGFAPNNTYYEEFDPKSYQSGSSTADTFTETLKSKWDDGNDGYVTGLDPETAIPDGMLPRDIGEFRSYYQTPFIYWNKLWQIFQKKAESITGYTWDLDSNWFNTTNPYYSKLVYMLKPFTVKNGTSLENYYTKWGQSALARSLGRSTTPGTPQSVKKLAMPSGASIVSNNKVETYPLMFTYGDIGQPSYDSTYPHYPTNVAVFKCPDDFTSITFKWTFNMYTTTKVSGSHFRDNAGLIVSVKLWGCDSYDQSNSRLVQTNNYIIRHEGSNFTYSDYVPVDSGSSDNTNYNIYYNFNSNFHASASKCGPYCYFTIECSYTNSDPMTNGLSDAGYTYYEDTSSLGVVLSSGAFRSGAHFTLNDLWNNDYNLFEQILNYCKMYRILIFADHINKKLKFIPFTRYFKDYTITDWTDKVDLSKDFTITPLTFENKYVLFNYKDNDSKLGKKYKEAWGVNYGEKKIITNYNFNQEEKKLFEKEITSSITNTDFSLSWTNLYDRNTISYSFPAEVFPYAKDDNNKSTDNFGAFFFHNGKRNFDTSSALHMRDVSISDDTTFQQSNDTYYYSQAQSATSVSSYPALDILNSDNEKLCIFNIPNENYTSIKNLSGALGIYDMFWKMYIDERYNIQNKQVTCYIKLTPKDFIEFEYRNFVTIDGVLYMVNKIYDYDVSSNRATKVDLITVQNLSSYYVDYYCDYLNVSPTSVNIDGNSGTQDITVSAYQNAWNYEILNEDLQPTTTSQITLTRVNDTKLRVTKNGDYNLHFTIRFYTPTRSVLVPVTGVRNPYIRFFPSSITTRKEYSDEFDILIESNFTNVNMIASSTIQWYNSNTGQWRTTAFQAASYVSGWGSGGSAYNIDHEDRSFTIHIKIVNPTSSGNVMFFESTPVTQYYYVPYTAIDAGTLTLDETEMNVGYRAGATWGVTGTSSSPWSWTVPSGVNTYGGLSGVAGTISTTFNVPANTGQPGSSKTCTITNEEGLSATFIIHFIND